MKSTLYPSIASWIMTAAATALVAAACGGAPGAVGENPQAISDEPEEGGGSNTSDACDGGTPIEEGGEDCVVVANGLCFATNEAACACDGCGLQDCAIAESFPAQAHCQNMDDPDVTNPDEPVSSDGGGEPSCGGTDPAGGGSNGHPGDACSAGSPRGGEPDARCDFIVGELCFDSAAAACSCAGCEADQCVVLESYPAQIGCTE